MNRILFMIINNELKIISDNNIDHREWYRSLGLDESIFENIVRGYVLDNKIIFFKGSNLSYDNEVIEKACIFSPMIRRSLNNESLEVYCGMIINSYNSKWEPIVKINNDEIDNYKVKEEVKEKPIVEPKELSPIVEFKNNYEDPKFIKIATIVTIIVIGLILIIKILLFNNKVLQITNPLDILLSLIEIVLLIISIYGYQTKKSFAKYLSLIASITIILTLDIYEIIIGVLYFLFSIDQNYFIKIINKVKKGDKNV